LCRNVAWSVPNRKDHVNVDTDLKCHVKPNAQLPYKHGKQLYELMADMPVKWIIRTNFI